MMSGSGVRPTFSSHSMSTLLCDKDTIQTGDTLQSTILKGLKIFIILCHGAYSQMVLIGCLIALLMCVSAFQVPESLFHFSILWSASICYGFKQCAILQVFMTDLRLTEIFTC